MFDIAFVCPSRSVCTAKMQWRLPRRRTCRTWTWVTWGRSSVKKAKTPRANQRSLNWTAAPETNQAHAHAHTHSLPQPTSRGGHSPSYRPLDKSHNMNSKQDDLSPCCCCVTKDVCCLCACVCVCSTRWQWPVPPPEGLVVARPSPPSVRTTPCLASDIHPTLVDIHTLCLVNVLNSMCGW